MKLKTALAVSMLLILAGYLLSASNRPSPRSLTLFFTGYVQGGYAPCGCPVASSGGLARRAGYLNDFRRRTGAYDLQVDLGNYFSAPGSAAGTVNELMFESLKVMPVQVMNLGADDL